MNVPPTVFYGDGEKTNKIVRLNTIFYRIAKFDSPGKDLGDGLRSRVGGSWEAVPQRGWGAGWGLKPLTESFLVLQMINDTFTCYLP